ncbi:3-phosphoshikimate 1-carboxyvinyltransferase [Tepidibacter formicigenes]|jgi:3-phosphoshikimate 1-carboxyvinyltransferase|uniref:3-phosphoshikimate 1-carboxyvinyltransferase n=1 Tax=Tepidibacter formicigenes DSM 15518 TaxID=1123349 RepID=A0A1M6P5A6_9FIRM|nr:3-phosphoshikimate 1-carboxyvinyltransferase [Tepidibacter formicigenes]SHK03145.1 3-phosphoshikimate 1-carboxyvinyltransferase [Tepidibacter formicigenes DSM 15518]
MNFNSISRLNGEIILPGDKSISHRSVMFSSISNGKNYIKNFLMGQDCLSTIDCFRKMGVNIDIWKNKDVIVNGVGLRGLKKPDNVLDVGNSGTTIRLIMGILSGQNFKSTLVGDESISKRPMKRVTEPLKEMGAKIDGLENGNFAPITIEGGNLKGINYKMPIASAQVKSAIILASLYSNSSSKIIEKSKSRNHTEIMLKSFGADINVDGLEIDVNPVDSLYPQEIYVPGDISSAAFFIAGASIIKGSEVLIKNVGLNPTRTGILDVLKDMGGNFEILNKEVICGEEIGDILVKYSNLNGVTIYGDLIPKLIDEIPIIAVMATQAEGQTIIKDAKELKVKESNRIKSVVENLKKMGADIEELEDGMVINGPTKLKGANIESFNDHRIAMAFSIASLISYGNTYIKNFNCVNISFPSFCDILKRISY